MLFYISDIYLQGKSFNGDGCYWYENDVIVDNFSIFEKHDTTNVHVGPYFNEAIIWVHINRYQCSFCCRRGFWVLCIIQYGLGKLNCCYVVWRKRLWKTLLPLVVICISYDFHKQKRCKQNGSNDIYTSQCLIITWRTMLEVQILQLAGI